jgi:hypothetical protein
MMQKTRKLRRANKEEVMAVRRPPSMVLPINKVATVNRKARTVSSMVDMASLLPSRVDMVSNSKRVMVSSRAATGDLQLDSRDSQAIPLSKVAGMGLLLLHHDINDGMLDLLVRGSHVFVVA